MPGSRFDDQLEMWVDTLKVVVAARGPLGTGVTVKEICAWVYQQGAAGDAAATEMTTTLSATNKAAKFFAGPAEWKLQLAQVGANSLQGGEAFAVAVALLLENGTEKVVWWGHPVTLILLPTRP